METHRVKIKATNRSLATINSEIFNPSVHSRSTRERARRTRYRFVFWATGMHLDTKSSWREMLNTEAALWGASRTSPKSSPLTRTRWFPSSEAIQGCSTAWSKNGRSFLWIACQTSYSLNSWSKRIMVRCIPKQTSTKSTTRIKSSRTWRRHYRILRMKRIHLKIRTKLWKSKWIQRTRTILWDSILMEAKSIIPQIQKQHSSKEPPIYKCRDRVFHLDIKAKLDKA